MLRLALPFMSPLRSPSPVRASILLSGAREKKQFKFRRVSHASEHPNFKVPAQDSRVLVLVLTVRTATTEDTYDVGINARTSTDRVTVAATATVTFAAASNTVSSHFTVAVNCCRCRYRRRFRYGYHGWAVPSVSVRN